jgi:hypothetical protein
MIHNEGQQPTHGPAGDNLEPYRRMVEMQRQIIELVKQHEQSKHECEQLREQVAHEIAMFCSPRQGISSRLRNLVARLGHRTRQLGARARRTIETTDAFSSSQQSSET